MKHYQYTFLWFNLIAMNYDQLDTDPTDIRWRIRLLFRYPRWLTPRVVWYKDFAIGNMVMWVRVGVKHD